MKKRNKAMIVVIISTMMLILTSIAWSADKQTGDQTSGTAAEVKQETLEAVEALKNYSIEKKDKAVNEVKLVLGKLDARIDNIQRGIEQKWDEMDQASREKAKASMQALRKKRNELSEWYGGLKYSSVQAWEQVKKGFIDGYGTLANAFDKAEDEFGSDESGKSDN